MTDRWLLAWALGSVAFGGASLLVPLYLVALGAGPIALGVLAASAAGAGAPGAIVVGRLADRTGRRRVFVVGGLAAIALSLLAMPFTNAVLAIVGLNAALWFAVAAVGPVVTLLATAGVAEDDWQGAIARLNRAQGWGWAAGLVLGAVWTAVLARSHGPLFAQRTFFVACGALALGAGIAAGRWLPAESADDGLSLARRSRRLGRLLDRPRSAPVRTTTVPALPGRVWWLTRLRSPRTVLGRFPAALRVYYLAVCCFFAGFGAFFAPLPLYLSGVGFGADAVFGLYVISSIGSAVCYGAAGRLAGRYDLADLQSASLLGRGLALPAVALLGGALGASAFGTAGAAIVFGVIGATWAIIAVTAVTAVTRLAPPSIRGEAVGVYVALSSIAGGAGSLLGGVLATAGYVVAFGAAGGLVVLGAAIVLVARRMGDRPW